MLLKKELVTLADSDMAVAAKTGTTSNNYDYWFCGYTLYYTVSVWTGYDYNTLIMMKITIK